MAWVGALFAVGFGSAALVAYAPVEAEIFDGEEVALVGSSLIAHAVPEKGVGYPFGEDVRFRRAARNGMSEREAIELSEAAVSDGLGVIFLEVDPFIKSMRTSRPVGECGLPSDSFRSRIWAARQRYVDAARTLTGFRQIREIAGEPDGLDRAQSIDAEQINQIYPPILHEPHCRERLNNLAETANAKDVELVLVLPPRSRFSSDMLGNEFNADLTTRAKKLAEEIDASLLVMSGVWPDSHFIDHAHLNQQGRDRFLQELRDWWSATR